LITTTAEGGAGGADSSTVIYSTTARTNVAYRVLGIIRSTQATAGTWATAPSLIQGAGGQAITAMGSIGYGQTWQSVTRTTGVTYYNTTGKPITLLAYGTSASSATVSTTVSVNGGIAVPLLQSAEAFGPTSANGTMIIPPMASYVLTDSASLNSRTTYELR